jgi:hypothetical protein
MKKITAKSLLFALSFLSMNLFARNEVVGLNESPLHEILGRVSVFKITKTPGSSFKTMIYRTGNENISELNIVVQIPDEGGIDINTFIISSELGDVQSVKISFDKDTKIATAVVVGSRFNSNGVESKVEITLTLTQADLNNSNGYNFLTKPVVTEKPL